MARRFIVGNAGAGFTMRQAKPGYDAAGAPLDGLNFDADHYPGRILGSGERIIFDQGRPSVSDTAPKAFSFAHGLGKAPDVVLGICQPRVYTNATTEGGPQAWQQFQYVPEISTTTWQLSGLGNPNMDFRFCTPFWFNGNNRGGPFLSGQGGFYFGGWWYGFDATNITFYFLSPGHFLFRWTALEVF